jgi:hypothetical protein
MMKQWTYSEFKEENHTRGYVSDGRWLTNADVDQTGIESPKGLHQDFADAGADASVFTEWVQNVNDNRCKERITTLRPRLIEVPARVVYNHFLDDLLIRRLEYNARQDMHDKIRVAEIWSTANRLRKLADAASSAETVPVLLLVDDGKGIQGSVISNDDGSNSGSALASLLLAAGQGLKANLGGGGSRGRGTSTLLEASDLNAFITVSRRTPSPGLPDGTHINRLAFGARSDGNVSINGKTLATGEVETLPLRARSLLVKGRKIDGPQKHQGWIPFVDEDPYIDELINDFGIDLPETGTAFIVPCPKQSLQDGFLEFCKVPALRFGVRFAKGDLQLRGTDAVGADVTLDMSTVGDVLSTIDFNDPEVVGKKRMARDLNVLYGMEAESRDSFNRVRNLMADPNKAVSSGDLLTGWELELSSIVDGVVPESGFNSATVLRALDEGKAVGIKVNCSFKTMNGTEKSVQGVAHVLVFSANEGGAVSYFHRDWMLIPCFGTKTDHRTKRLVVAVNIPHEKNGGLHELLRRAEAAGHHTWSKGALGESGLMGKKYFDARRVMELLMRFPAALESLLFPEPEPSAPNLFISNLCSFDVGRGQKASEACLICGHLPCNCPSKCPNCGEERPCGCPPPSKLQITQLSNGRFKIGPGQSNPPEEGSKIEVSHAYIQKGTPSDLKKYAPGANLDPEPSVVKVKPINAKLLMAPYHDSKQGGVRFVVEIESKDWSVEVQGLPPTRANGSLSIASIKGDLFIEAKEVK